MTSYYGSSVDIAAEIERTWVNLGVARALERLGIEFTRQGRRYIHGCLFHAENTPSAVLELGPQGTLRDHCFGACGRSWDIHALVGVLSGYSPSSSFRELLKYEAELLGRYDLLPEFERSSRDCTRSATPSVQEERDYPPQGEILEFLAERCGYLACDGPVREHLEGRGFDVEALDGLGLAFALDPEAPCPRWAWRQRQSWAESGHRIIVPVVDASGAVRSVRAWGIGGTQPKRLPPAGYRAKGLIMACMQGRALLSGHWPSDLPVRVVIAEGEPDWLTWLSRYSDADVDVPIVLGVTSGAWGQAIVNMIPEGAYVEIVTHHDLAGEKYAQDIMSSLVCKQLTIVRI